MTRGWFRVCLNRQRIKYRKTPRLSTPLWLSCAATPQTCKEVHHVGEPGGNELHFLTLARMSEFQSLGMEGLTRKTHQRVEPRNALDPRSETPARIDPIPKHRISLICQMDPDLMGPAGVGPKTQ